MIAEPGEEAVQVPWQPTARAREASGSRLRALLEHVAEVLDLALGASCRETIDVLLDLSDEIHAELRL